MSIFGLNNAIRTSGKAKDGQGAREAKGQQATCPSRLMMVKAAKNERSSLSLAESRGCTPSHQTALLGDAGIFSMLQ